MADSPARQSSNSERREARRAAVQARVLEATKQLLSEGQTFADLHVEAIAARAGISRTTFYDYFSDKRALLLSLGATLVDDALAEREEWRPGGDPEATRAELRRIVKSLVRMYRHPVALAIIEATFYDDQVRAAWRAEQDRHIERAERLLRAESDGGRFQPHRSSVEARARALHWAVHGTALHEVALRQNVDEDDIVEALVDVNILGVRGVLP